MRCPSKCGPATCSSSIRRPASFPPFAPSTANPFTGFILPGAGASGINIIDNRMQNPSVQQFNLGFERELPWTSPCCAWTASTTSARTSSSADLIGEVFNPVVGGPDRVVNLESSVNTPLRRAVGQRRAPRRAARIPRGLYVCQGVQLRQRRPDPVLRTGPIDPNEPAPASTARLPTTSAIASRSRPGDAPGRAPRRADHDVRVRRADGHPVAGRAVASAGVPAQRGRPAVPDRRRPESRARPI